jgi:hypothetical protein
VTNSADLAQRVSGLWDNTSPVAGHLFKRSLAGLPGALHYAVRLNSDHVIEWRPSHNGQAWDRGVLMIEAYSPDFQRVRDIEYLKRDRIIQNILSSIHCFHAQWDYCVRGWNCEHWARLVACGDPISYQARELYFSIGTMTGGHFRNPDAFRKLVETEAPPITQPDSPPH